VEQPWERRPKESEQAYQAFLIFRDLGAERSHEAARERLGKGSGYLRVIEDWSGRHEWIERARAWDNHVLKEVHRKAAKNAARWHQRRLDALEEVFRDAEKLHEKAARMLDFPLQKVEHSADGKTTHIYPARWTFQTAALILKTAAELKAAVFAAVDLDPAEMSDAEIGAVTGVPLPERSPEAAGGVESGQPDG
jgi:hypothetical protein